MRAGGEADSLRLGGENRGRCLLIDLRTAVSRVGWDPVQLIGSVGACGLTSH